MIRRASYKRALVGLAMVVLAAASTVAQQAPGTPGSPSGTTTIDGKQLPAPPPKFGGKIGRTAAESTPYWTPRVTPKAGAPNVLLIITDDAGYGVAEHVRRRDPDPGPRPDRRERAALHELPLDGAVLADARGAHHRAEPPLGRLRRDRRAGDRLSRLRQHHHQGQGDDRPDPARTTATAPRGSARTTTRRSSRPARPAPSTSGRPAWASSTSTASWAATPTSGSRETSSATRRPSTPTWASRAGT